MTLVTVHVKKVAKRLVKPEDSRVAGVYYIRIDDDVPAGHVAGVALDVFHSRVAIGCLDDFEVAVKKGGKTIVEDDDYEPYSGEDKGELC